MNPNNKRDKLKQAANIFFSPSETSKTVPDNAESVESVNSADSISNVNGVERVKDVGGVDGGINVELNKDSTSLKKINSERVSLYTTLELKQFIEVMVWYDRTNNVSGYINSLMSKDREARASEYEVALEMYKKFKI